MAPECCLDTYTDIGPSADIFSFAVVMWECLNHEQPWRGMDSASIFELVKRGKRCDQQDIDGTDDGFDPDGYVKLMHECWKQNSDARPIINYVQNRLREIMEKYVSEKRERRKSSLGGSVTMLSSDSVVDDETAAVSIELSEVVSKKSL